MASPLSEAGGLPPGCRKLTTIDLVGGIYCQLCHLTLQSKRDFDTHYLTHNPDSKETVYTCVVCHTPFNSYPTFRGHCYNIHVIKDRFKCQRCNKTLSKPEALEKHIRAMHNFKCNSCDTQFPTKQELNLHSILHKNDANKPPYPCQSCGEEIGSITICEDHIDRHSTFTYNCPICDVPVNKDTASEHLAIHFGDDVLNVLNEEADMDLLTVAEDSSVNMVGGVACCHCSKLCKDRLETEGHFAEEHPGQKVLYTCNICSKQFEKYSLFGNHCYYHYSKDKFQCTKCDKTFSRLSLLVEHASAHRGGGGGRFPCAHCPRSFHSARHLCHHARVTHKLAALQCPHSECTALLESPRDLANHCKLHVTALDNWCRRCGLQFHGPTSAEKHLEVHKTKLYHCSVCGRRYGERYLLMKHIPQHFESVFHMCKTCGKVFDAKNRLIEHMKVHTESKDFVCKTCGKTFARSNHLAQHLNIHSGAKPYRCIACPRMFASKPNWFKHMTRIHNISAMARKQLAKAVAKGDLPEKAEVVTTPVPPEIITPKPQPATPPPLEAERDAIDLLLCPEVPLSALSAADVAAVLPDSTDQFVSEILCPAPPASVPSSASAEVLTAEGVGLEEAAMPCEYGPDFGDDHVTTMPHINPQLLQDLDFYQTLPQTYQEYQQVSMDIEPQKWEPIITKVYDYGFTDLDDNAGRLLNTDIF